MESTPAPAPVLPGSARLAKATLASIAVATLVLVVAVLPAEYGIDPTGLGARLGLGALRDAAAPVAVADDSAAADPAADAPSRAAADAGAANGAAADAGPDTALRTANAALAGKAEAAFGFNDGQVMDASAYSASSGALRTDTFSVTLEPGKGAEVKAAMKAGDGLVFRWTASGDVAVDMHGEAVGAKGTWTSYAVESAQREAAGTFVAAFDGTHGWYWLNRGRVPVTVQIEVAGFQPSLYRP